MLRAKAAVTVPKLATAGDLALGFGLGFGLGLGLGFGLRRRGAAHHAEPNAVSLAYFQLPCATKCVKVVTLSE